MKKAIAVILGITMTFGIFAVPNNYIAQSLPTASAYTVKINDCKFEYDLDTVNDVTTAKIKKSTCTR